jgi:hypothetical protein
MKVLLFGATGAAGGSVLTVCLNERVVQEVRVITRRPLKLAHKKLLTLIHKDFLDYSSLTAAFTGLDACLFCLGVSVTQVRQEDAYRRITHDFTLAAARLLKKESPKAAFHYISGYGTRADSRQMWARVKGQTEQELINLMGAVCWRPGFIDTPPSDSGRGSRSSNAVDHKRAGQGADHRERRDPRHRRAIAHVTTINAETAQSAAKTSVRAENLCGPCVLCVVVVIITEAESRPREVAPRCPF